MYNRDIFLKNIKPINSGALYHEMFSPAFIYPTTYACPYSLNIIREFLVKNMLLQKKCVTKFNTPTPIINFIFKFIRCNVLKKSIKNKFIKKYILLGSYRSENFLQFPIVPIFTQRKTRITQPHYYSRVFLWENTGIFNNTVEPMFHQDIDTHIQDHITKLIKLSKSYKYQCNIQIT